MSPTSTAGSPIRYPGVRKAGPMRAAEAVADFEKASAHAGDAEDGQGVPSRRVQSLTASEQRDVLWLSPCWRGAGGLACLRGWDRSVAIPSMPSRFAVAHRASIDRMSPPR